MKLVAVADTHNEYHKLIVPDGDVFIQAGDIDLCNLKDAVRYNKWLGTLPHKYKIVVGGNHDVWLAKNYMQIKHEVLDNCIYLENSGVELEGINFWGSPMSPTFGNWYFMADRGEDIKHYWDAIPENTDVLITHSPPQRILDEVPRGIWYDYAGCKDLHNRVKQIKPVFHIFGHIHCGAGEKKDEHTQYCNVAVMGEDYTLINEPMQLNINKGDKK